MMDFTIVRLQDYPHFAALCSAWDDATWPRSAEIEEFFADHYQEAAQNNGTETPQVWLALKDQNTPIGMISLIADDHPDYLHMSPWLASAFILPEYRGKGVFQALHSTLIESLRMQKRYDAIYVYSHINFSKLGSWIAIKQIDDPFEPKKVTLYRYEL